MHRTIALALTFLAVGQLAAEDSAISRCELIPEPSHRVSFQVDGVERTQWHFGQGYPRPFLYPLLGPSGTSLTRMGHPGAENHDHHQSVWFAHHDIDGESYWANGRGTTIRQKNWYAYEDGDSEAIMASSLGWIDKENREVMQQDLAIALIPRDDGEYLLEIQSEFRPGEGKDTTQIGKTNFGFFAVRVAKSLSVHFGGGTLTNSEGAQGEPEIFGKPAKWMDYSGPVRISRKGSDRQSVTLDETQQSTAVEGITYFDHPSNPRHPTHWHVRRDGWMGASFAMNAGLEITAEKPLLLRYMLHIHRGGYNAKIAKTEFDQFAGRARIVIRKSKRPHYQYEAVRAEAPEKTRATN